MEGRAGGEGMEGRGGATRTSSYRSIRPRFTHGRYSTGREEDIYCTAPGFQFQNVIVMICFS